MDPDSDPVPFIGRFQDTNKNKIYLSFLLITNLLEGTFTVLYEHQSWKIILYIVLKKSQNSRNQGFSYFFYLMIKGSRSGSVQTMTESDPDPWSPKNYGSCGSGSGSTTLFSWAICCSVVQYCTVDMKHQDEIELITYIRWKLTQN